MAILDGKFIGVGSNDDIEGLIGPTTRVKDVTLTPANWTA